MAESRRAAKQELLTSARRRFWVTLVHYLRPAYPVKTIVTGMARDETFLIDKGQVVGPVKNLRFTQSILEALGEAEIIGQTAKLASQAFTENFIPGIRVPVLRVARFVFTSAFEC